MHLAESKTLPPATLIEPCAANEPGRPAGGRHSSGHRRREGLINNAAINKLRDRRVTVMGLGRHGGGVAAARFLVQQGARVTISDMASRTELADSLSQLDDLELAAVHLDGHRDKDFAHADVVVVNPAVRAGHHLVQLARQTGASVTSELELFLARCQGQVVGVTGTNGKSTTAAMLAEILQAAGRDTYLGGNIGRSLLGELPRIHTETWCVLEVSSFQLAWLSEAAPRPAWAAITNLAPNHLDWHEALSDYREAKRKIFGPATRRFDPTGALGEPTHDLATEMRRLPPLPVTGEHNRKNAALAATIAREIGCANEAVSRGLREFRGLPHRLEPIGAWEGRTFINDSQATTPESTIAAIEAYGPNCWLLAGGKDKGADLSDLATAIARSTRGAAFFGQLGPQLHDLTRSLATEDCHNCFAGLREAVAWCVAQSSPGDAILLSPGCASLDQYRDYADRAADFRAVFEALCRRDRHVAS
ncbi:MAG: UDP-N-acetylmuramoyl-L-alanine--D-glutamate ligase [Planctomycetota bacterium]|nr:MAG: UDP-N-acetylmuramoyl-L-alanine--D-glutamate ligase [Planctomycetota bacterium]